MNGVFFSLWRVKEEDFKKNGGDWRDRELPHQKHREERQQKKIKNLR
jgi:hypothetical protein